MVFMTEPVQWLPAAVAAAVHFFPQHHAAVAVVVLLDPEEKREARYHSVSWCHIHNMLP